MKQPQRERVAPIHVQSCTSQSGAVDSVPATPRSPVVLEPREGLPKFGRPNLAGDPLGRVQDGNGKLACRARIVKWRSFMHNLETFQKTHRHGTGKPPLVGQSAFLR